MLNIRGAALAALLLCSFCAFAGGKGELNEQTPLLTYTGGPAFVPNATSQVGAGRCPDTTFTCDVYALTVNLPLSYDKKHPYAIVVVSVGWAQRALDFETFVYEGDKAADIVAANIITGKSSSNDPETMVFPALPGSHTYQVVTYPNIATADTITGTISLIDPPAPYPQKGPKVMFAEYKAPKGIATSAGEPSIAFVPKSGHAFFLSNLETDKVVFDDPAPGMSTWSKVSSPFSRTSLDPIMAGDFSSGRIWVSELLGVTSLLSYTDDEGVTWVPSEGAGIPAGVDHQTLGTGPYPPALSVLSANPLYPQPLYYCSQDQATALCSRSDDGGLTFAPPVPIYGVECAGIHGHVKVAPNDGTVYVPNGSCADGPVSRPAVTVSEDAGLTWTVRTVTGALAGQGSDPTVAIASDGTVYFGYVNYDGRAHVALSHDKGKTWENDTDLSAPARIFDVVFPAIVAGDGDRAAIAFHGTGVRGPTGSLKFPGAWYLYVATTYDGGKNWVTQAVTPDDPVQGAGGICLGGITCSSTPDNRNLLDFMDAIIDSEGRILVGYADGCIGECVKQKGAINSFSHLGSIVRQSAGPRMYAEFDAPKTATTVSAEPAAEKQGNGLLLGALAPLMLMGFAFAALRRRRA